MRQFALGQKVVCEFGDWQNANNVPGFDPPKKYEILTIRRIQVNQSGIPFLGFRERCPHLGWPAVKFRPLDYDFVERTIKQLGLPALKK